jgi:cytochrome c5
MHPHFSSMLATLLLVIAGVTVLIMLEMTGKIKDSPRKKGWIFLHRILGYLFLIIFASMLVFMVVKAGGFQEKMPARAMIHIILALLLVPLIMIKVVIARRHAPLSTKLILLGTAIFGLAFGLTGITAGYYALHRSDKYADLSDLDEDILSMDGQKVTNRKCGKCHSLERIYQNYKSDIAWSDTINKMAELDYPNITTFDVKQIAGYLVQQQQRRHGEKEEKREAEIGKILVKQKCAGCHNLVRIFGVDKNQQEWTDTVGRMMETDGESDFLSTQGKKNIITFLSRRGLDQEIKNVQEVTRQGTAEKTADRIKALVALKCSAGCHALDRVLREEKSKQEWVENVDSMVAITGDPDFLTEREKKDIVHFLSSRKQKKQEASGVRSEASGTIHPLVSSKCNVCHGLKRMHMVGKNKEEVTDIVETMAEGTGDPNYLSKQEKENIINIISGWDLQE